MVKEFAFWLESIVEDDPLADEVDVIVFKVNQNGGYYYLEMFGFEKEPNFCKESFRPLEAQHFNITKLKNINETLFEFRIKTMIDEAFNSQILKREFFKRQIFLWFNKLEFLFLV